MQGLRAEAKQLSDEVDSACTKLGVDALAVKQAGLTQDSMLTGFWDDTSQAQSVMKEISRIEAKVRPWLEVRTAVRDIVELISMNDESLASDLADQLALVQIRFDDLKQDLKFSGPYDDHDVIMSIHAGAGGNDAQDWTAMLLRMYVRYAETENWSVNTIDESPGEEAGIKSVTIEFTGNYVFGRLKGEHGVHRLVRLSPFNAESRETSFAKVEIMPKIDAPDEIAVDEKDLKIDVYRSGGHGGQSVNTTDSAVRITHMPTGMVVAIQNERSQLQNRETAMTILRSRLAQLQIEQHAAAVSELKGPNEQAAWGNQIRNYVLHPYKQVKDLRSRYETSNVDTVLDGKLDEIIDAYLEYSLGSSSV